MTTDDRVRLVAALKPVARLYHEELDDAFLEAWCIALADVPIEAVEQGLRAILRGERSVTTERDREFMPKPAELRRLFAPALGVADVLARLRRFKTAHLLGRKYAHELLPLDTLVIRALGGMEVVCGLDAERERFLVDRYLPEWRETARVRGWEMPAEAVALPGPAPLRLASPAATAGEPLEVEE